MVCWAAGVACWPEYVLRWVLPCGGEVVLLGCRCGLLT